MAKYRSALPQLDGGLFLTDGGLETTLIYLEGWEIPHFASFHLLQTPEGEAALRDYFKTYVEIAQRFDAGLVLESASWRANPDWGGLLGYSPDALAEANRKSVQLLADIRDEGETERTKIVVSGCVGPRGDGYVPGALMNEREAEEYHRAQIETFADSPADMVGAITINYVEEAVGIARAAQKAELPVAVSFTVETDGHLPTGQSLRSAVEQVDDATAGYPSYYMINCAHPTHFEDALTGGKWLERLRGLRANASCKSHAELDASTELDTGDPSELGRQYARLRERLPRLNVVGGCCGTDHRHIERIAEACSPQLLAAG